MTMTMTMTMTTHTVTASIYHNTAVWFQNIGLQFSAELDSEPDDIPFALVPELLVSYD